MGSPDQFRPTISSAVIDILNQARQVQDIAGRTRTRDYLRTLQQDVFGISPQAEEPTRLNSAQKLCNTIGTLHRRPELTQAKQDLQPAIDELTRRLRTYVSNLGFSQLSEVAVRCTTLDEVYGFWLVVLTKAPQAQLAIIMEGKTPIAGAKEGQERIQADDYLRKTSPPRRSRPIKISLEIESIFPKLTVDVPVEYPDTFPQN